MSKKPLSPEEIEAQTAVELPDRKLMALVAVVIAGNTVFLPIGIAANVCGVQANVLAQQLAQTGSATCVAQGLP